MTNPGHNDLKHSKTKTWGKSKTSSKITVTRLLTGIHSNSIIQETQHVATPQLCPPFCQKTWKLKSEIIISYELTDVQHKNNVPV